jgi:uncharacterized protein (TIGR04255 family)
MTERRDNLDHPPIVEAVLDLDCAMPPTLDITALEAPARDAYRDRYPGFRPVYLHEHAIRELLSEAPTHTAQRVVHAYQFVTADERQVVQVRSQGFSFNRLAPYSTLDDYLPEIRRVWESFVDFAAPVRVELIRLRYINRIPLPAADGAAAPDLYVQMSPRLPGDDRLSRTAFLSQQVAVETATGNNATIILASQPAEAEGVPVVLDIETSRAQPIEPNDWESIISCIESLRELKNAIFFNSLTPRCMELFNDAHR